MQLANTYYEPGRQDRCYRWVWAKYIRDLYNVEYPTLLRWIREERGEAPPPSDPTLF